MSLVAFAGSVLTLLLAQELMSVLGDNPAEHFKLLKCSAGTAQGSRSLPGCMRSASQSEGKYQRLCGQERK